MWKNVFLVTLETFFANRFFRYFTCFLPVSIRVACQVMLSCGGFVFYHAAPSSSCSDIQPYRGSCLPSPSPPRDPSFPPQPASFSPLNGGTQRQSTYIWVFLLFTFLHFLKKSFLYFPFISRYLKSDNWKSFFSKLCIKIINQFLLGLEKANFAKKLAIPYFAKNQLTLPPSSPPRPPTHPTHNQPDGGFPSFASQPRKADGGGIYPQANTRHLAFPAKPRPIY